MFNISVLCADGTVLTAEEASYSINDGLLIIEVPKGTNFFNWNQVVYMGVSQVGE
jgi:hypothetical protein